MEISLLVNGREMVFTKEELSTIVEEYLLEHISKKEIKEHTEGNLFKVDFNSIDQKMFEIKRSSPEQEEIRLIILEAFEEVRKKPKIYAKKFDTMVAKQSMKPETLRDLIELSDGFCDHFADWVEQALEWAQRLQNGESWRKLCQSKDTSTWRRIIKWKNGRYRIVGGSKKNTKSTTFIEKHDLSLNTVISDAVFLMVYYEN